MSFIEGIDGGVFATNIRGKEITFGNEKGAAYPPFWKYDSEGLLISKGNLPGWLTKEEKNRIMCEAMKSIKI